MHVFSISPNFTAPPTCTGGNGDVSPEIPLEFSPPPIQSASRLKEKLKAGNKEEFGYSSLLFCFGFLTDLSHSDFSVSLDPENNLPQRKQASL